MGNRQHGKEYIPQLGYNGSRPLSANVSEKPGSFIMLVSGVVGHIRDENSEKDEKTDREMNAPSICPKSESCK